MDDFERLVVEEAIRSRVGRIERIDLCGRGVRTPMSVFIETAERWLDRPIDLFWIDDGIAGHFCLPGERSFAVVFHTRELLLTAYVRSLFEDIWSDELRRTISERIALKLVAEFLLQRRLVDQALQTFARSSFDTGITIREPTLDDLEGMPISEQYLVMWFFGLGHELGHALKPSARETLLGLTTLELGSIARQIENYIDLRFPDPADRDTLKRIIRRNDSLSRSKCYASASVVREEALADIFALLVISEVAQVIVGRDSHINGRLLLSEMLLAWEALILIDQCRVLASWFTDISDEVEEQNTMLSNVALGIRMNLFLHVLTDTDARDYLYAEYAGIEIFNGLSIEELQRGLAPLNDRARVISDALKRVREFLSSPEMRDTSLFFALLQRARDDPTLRYETATFVHIARVLGLQTPALDMLADLH